MKKLIFTLLTLFIFSTLFAQNKSGIKGITLRGVKGIQKSLAQVMAQARAIPTNFKVHLRPELEGPQPIGQNPNAKHVSKYGTVSSNNNTNSRLNGGTVPTQPVVSNFLTIWGNYGTAIPGRESPYTPPDNCGDVGTTQIIATANCRMKVFDKPSAGTALTTATGTSTDELPAVLNVDLNIFFTDSSLGITSISDPHVRYDRLTGRWFIVAIEVNHKTNNSCCIAVSNTSLASPSLTASSTFNIYYFNITGTGGASTDFFDYPTLGVDRNYLYIGGNMFANQSRFSGCNMWVVNKADLIANKLTVTGFPHGAAKTDIYTPQGVHNDDPAATEGYFIGASQIYYSKLNLKRVTYGATPTLSNDIALTTLAMYTPKTVPTLGGTSIDGNDRRLCAAMIKKNKITGVANLWIAQGTLLNQSGVGGSGGDRDGALWMEIGNLTTTPSIVQSATLYDSIHASSSAEYYTYPTIALSGQGHSIMGFTSAGPAKYAQAAAAGRYRTDPAASFQLPVDFTNTGSSYNPGASRWGDYTQTVVDPNDDMTMWTFSEYVPTTNAWGVRAAQFKAPPPLTPVLSITPACGATTNVTINGTATSNPNAEFFDPGAGFNRLNVSVTGASAVTVSNIVFVSPTQLTANFYIPANALSGTYKVFVINPDGQKDSTTFTLNCAAASCGDPTGLNSSSIDNNTETASWTGVSGATSYSVSYELAGTGNWSADATTTSTSMNLSGLTAGTNYDWRVRATCSGVNGNYVYSQFTTSNTTPTSCDAPTGLTASSVTSNNATLSWTAPATGANSYDVDYKANSSSTWINAATATATTSVNVTGLTSSTLYDWRVKSNCSSGSSTYTTAQFTTTADVNTCPDPYEPNDNLSSAKTISAGTVNASIGVSGDQDYFSFSTSGSQKNIKVTLTTPYNANLTLYNNSGGVLGTSASSNTAPAIVAYNTNKAGTYKVSVVGATANDFSASQCYTLNVTTGNTNFTATIGEELGASNILRGGLKLYPVPATNAVTVSFDAYAKGNADIVIINQLGQQVLFKKVLTGEGINFNTIDVSALRSGVYTLKVNNGKEIQTKKMIISR